MIIAGLQAVRDLVAVGDIDACGRWLILRDSEAHDRLAAFLIIGMNDLLLLLEGSLWGRGSRGALCWLLLKGGWGTELGGRTSKVA